MVNLAPNATRILGNWGDTIQKMEKIECKLKTCNFVNNEGELLFSQPLHGSDDGFPNYYVHRSHTQLLMYEYAVSIGVKFVFDTRVTEFFEDKNEAGVIIDGKRVTADCVIAADGVHSKARKFVTGVADDPKASGFAIFRSFFPIETLQNDPKIKHLVPEKGTDSLHIWIGENAHGILQTNQQLDGCTVFLTHKASKLPYQDIEMLDANYAPRTPTR